MSLSDDAIKHAHELLQEQIDRLSPRAEHELRGVAIVVWNVDDDTQCWFRPYHQSGKSLMLCAAALSAEGALTAFYAGGQYESRRSALLKGGQS